MWEKIEMGKFVEMLQARTKLQIQSGRKGKHYMVSDIHGMYGSYLDVIKKLNPRDHLYILGDVLDRGNGGIKILQDIRKRQANARNNPEITFLMGNHEMQFLMTVCIMKKHELGKKDMENILRRENLKQDYELLKGAMTQEKAQQYKKRISESEVVCQKMMKQKRVNQDEMDIIVTWLKWNKGYTTIFDYLDLPKEEQQAICKFLNSSYLILPKTIQGKDYLLVHAMPPRNPNMLKEMKMTGEGYRFKDLDAEECDFMLQEREISTYVLCRKKGFITICGHTPKAGEIVKDEKNGLIRLDAGCGHKSKKSKLALFCVEDDEVQYIDEKETNRTSREL